MGRVAVLSCLAVLSLAVDLLRQAQMRREVRLEVVQEQFLALGLTHPSTLPLLDRATVYSTLGPF